MTRGLLAGLFFGVLVAAAILAVAALQIGARPERPVMIAPEVMTSIAAAPVSPDHGPSITPGALSGRRVVQEIASPRGLAGAERSGLPAVPVAMPAVDPSRIRASRDLARVVLTPPGPDVARTAAQTVEVAPVEDRLALSPTPARAMPVPPLVTGTGAEFPNLPETPDRPGAVDVAEPADTEGFAMPEVPQLAGVSPGALPQGIARAPAPERSDPGAPRPLPATPAAAPVLGTVAETVEEPLTAKADAPEASIAAADAFAVAARPGRAPQAPAMGVSPRPELARPSLPPSGSVAEPGVAILLLSDGAARTDPPVWAAAVVPVDGLGPDPQLPVPALPVVRTETGREDLSRIAMVLAQNPSVPSLYVAGVPDAGLVRDLLGLARVAGRGLILGPGTGALAGTLRQGDVTTVHAFPSEGLASGLALAERFARRDGAVIVPVADTPDARAEIARWLDRSRLRPISLNEATRRLSR